MSETIHMKPQLVKTTIWYRKNPCLNADWQNADQWKLSSIHRLSAEDGWEEGMPIIQIHPSDLK